MMKVDISKGGNRGTILYNEDSKKLTIDFPDPDVVDEIKDYLNAEQIYRIPESQEIDDYREKKARPMDSLMHMELGLCTLWRNTEVMVNWGPTD
jgi:hypothetical protein